MARIVYIITNYSTNQTYAGLTMNFDRRLWHHRKRKSYLFVGNHEVVKTVAMTDARAQHFEAKAVRYLRNIGFQIENVAKPGGLGGKELLWTKKRCGEEAMKFATRSEFSRNSRSAYGSARRNGWLNDVCSHMKNCDPMRYLKPRGTKWHYVRRVPEIFAAADSRDLIQISLKTSSLDVAKLRRDEMEHADNLFWKGAF